MWRVACDIYILQSLGTVNDAAVQARVAMVDKKILKLIEFHRKQENLCTVGIRDCFDWQKQRESLLYITAAMGTGWIGEYASASPH